MFFQIPIQIQDPTSILPALITIVVLGIIWLIIRFIFKLAMKGFMVGCFVILVIGVISMLSGVLSLTP